MEKYKTVRKPKHIIKSFVTLGEIVEKFPHGGKVTIAAMKRKKMIPKNVNYVGVSSVVPISRRYNIEANVFDGRVEERMHQNNSTVTNIIYYSHKSSSDDYDGYKPTKNEKKAQKTERKSIPKTKNHLSAAEKKKRIIAVVVLAVTFAVAGLAVVGGFHISKKLNKLVEPTIIVVVGEGENFAGQIVKIEDGKYKISLPPTKEGFEFVGWYLDKEFKNKAIDDNDFVIVGAPSNKKRDIKIYARWEMIIIKPTYSIVTQNVSTNGSLSVDKSVAKEGEVVTLTVVPIRGYMLAVNGLSVKFNEEELAVKEVGDQRLIYSFVMPSGDVVIKAKYAVFFSVGLQIEYDSSKQIYKVITKGTVKEANIVIPSEYDDGINGIKPVTEIGANAFINQKITAVSMPSIIKLGEGVFLNCDKLTSVIMPKVESISDNTFAGCLSLAVVDFEGIAKIGNSAFAGCETLVSVKMEELTVVGDNAFKNCKKLNSVVLPLLQEIGTGAFFNCINLTEINGQTNVTKIGASAFEGCAKLSNGDFNKLLTIGNYGFKDCKNLKDDKINFSSVTAIGDSAFENCTFTSINFPKVKVIGKLAFANLEYLTAVSISNVETIKDSAFKSCIALSDIVMNNVVTIGSNAFLDCKELSNLMEMKSLINIGDFAFANCLKLSEVAAPILKEIGENAFNGCVILTGINLPKLEKIGEKTFFNCNALINVVLPSIKSIGEFAFTGCENAILYLNKDCAVPTQIWYVAGCKIYVYSETDPGASIPPKFLGTEIKPDGWWHFDADGKTPTFIY